MNRLDVANVANLTGLWRCMGARDIDIPGSRAAASSLWPYRMWVEPADSLNTEFSEEFCSHTRSIDNVVVPVWGGSASPLVQYGFEQLWSLTAMCVRPGPVPPDVGRVTLTAVSSTSEARLWTQIASESFGYEVDFSVIQRLLTIGVGIYLIQIGNKNLGTVLLYEHNSIIGIHMLGVLPSARRLGFAREAMLAVMRRAIDIEADLLVLQAAEKAKPLYLSLGFVPQFSIAHYLLPSQSK